MIINEKLKKAMNIVVQYLSAKQDTYGVIIDPNKNEVIAKSSSVYLQAVARSDMFKMTSVVKIKDHEGKLHDWNTDKKLRIHPHFFVVATLFHYIEVEIDEEGEMVQVMVYDEDIEGYIATNKCKFTTEVTRLPEIHSEQKDLFGKNIATEMVMSAGDKTFRKCLALIDKDLAFDVSPKYTQAAGEEEMSQWHLVINTPLAH